MILTSSLSERTVRLTKKEMEQLRKRKLGETFLHINLQHSETSYKGVIGEKWQAIEIIENGIENKVKISKPELDYKNAVIVQLLDIELSIPIKNLENNLSNFDNFKVISNFLLADDKGLYESLYSKYAKVRGLTYAEIRNMEAFVRKFKILKFL